MKLLRLSAYIILNLVSLSILAICYAFYSAWMVETDISWFVFGILCIPFAFFAYIVLTLSNISRLIQTMPSAKMVIAIIFLIIVLINTIYGLSATWNICNVADVRGRFIWMLFVTIGMFLMIINSLFTDNKTN